MNPSFLPAIEIIEGRVSDRGGGDREISRAERKKNDNAPINFTITCAMHITSSEALH